MIIGKKLCCVAAEENSMTLDQLQMPIKIVEEGSLLTAAEALHRSSQRTALLDRDQYRATLTDEGRILYEETKTILQQIGLLKRLTNRTCSPILVICPVSMPLCGCVPNDSDSEPARGRAHFSL